MKRITNRITHAYCTPTTFMFCLLFCLISCNKFIPNLSAANEESSRDSSETNREVSQSIPLEFMGIHFSCYLPSVSSVEAVQKPAVFLQEKDDKPVSVRPQYISIKLHGRYAERHKESFFEPKIEIYRVEEFREALARSADYVATFDSKIESLRRIIAQRPPKIENLPFIPFIDGTPIITTHVKYGEFGNGRGLFYVTQFNIETSLVNNDGLTYIFQGLSNDNQYYVVATFPLTTQFLPENYRANKYKNYELPELFYDPEVKDSNERKYKEYVEQIGNELETTNVQAFSPDLNSIEKSISSLQINFDSFAARQPSATQ